MGSPIETTDWFSLSNMSQSSKRKLEGERRIGEQVTMTQSGCD